MAQTPRETVDALDRYIVGQQNGKRCVAIALRNRWRRQQVSEDLIDEIMPKNIIMIGATGVGKTEIARRIAKMVNAPFIKIEASKFTEVGYVGRDVESMIRDLMEISIGMVKKQRLEVVQEKAAQNVESRILDLLFPPNPVATSTTITTNEDGEEESIEVSDDSKTREKFAQKIADGKFDEKMVDIKMQDRPSGPNIEFFPITGNDSLDINLKDMMSSLMPKRSKNRKVTVKDARKIFQQEEAEKLIDMDDIHAEALSLVEQNGIIFLDEIDKVISRSSNASGDVSREGVQRDLLPIVEGSTVSTKYGPVKTDHILFIAAGAFHLAKPSDLIPELQGRFPIRVELDSLTKEDFIRILTEPKNSLVRQYTELLKTEEVYLDFQGDAIEEMASIAYEVNTKTENIGARRLHAILEKILEEVSFKAPEIKGEKISITKEYVRKQLGDIVRDQDLSRYIL